MPKSFYAVIVAAGSGSRMGAGLPKQFLEMDGKPILRVTIEKFTSAVPGVRIVTVLAPEYIQYWREYCATANFSCPQTLVAGGITRFHSVRNALSRIPDGVIVAIHDAVRPLVSEGLIREMYSHMDTCRALVPAIPCVDSLVRLEQTEDGTPAMGVPVDRNGMHAVQTPQMFRSEDVRAAYSQAYDTSFTDDSGVVSRHGIPVSYVAGERDNLKITTPRDLVLARAIASALPR